MWLSETKLTKTVQLKFQNCYIKQPPNVIVYKIEDAKIQSVTPTMLLNLWQEIDDGLNILRVTRGADIECLK